MSSTASTCSIWTDHTTFLVRGPQYRPRPAGRNLTAAVAEVAEFLAGVEAHCRARSVRPNG